jgi:hypothetical protein
MQAKLGLGSQEQEQTPIHATLFCTPLGNAHYKWDVHVRCAFTIVQKSSNLWPILSGNGNTFFIWKLRVQKEKRCRSPRSETTNEQSPSCRTALFLLYTTFLNKTCLSSASLRLLTGGFFMYVLYSTLLHLPPLRFHCVGGCWDRTQDCCGYGNGSQTP